MINKMKDGSCPTDRPFCNANQKGGPGKNLILNARRKTYPPWVEIFENGISVAMGDLKM